MDRDICLVSFNFWSNGPCRYCTENNRNSFDLLLDGLQSLQPILLIWIIIIFLFDIKGVEAQR